MKEYTEPRMHTAEHILNQTMIRMFQTGRAFSSHIEKKKSKCDYRFNRNLTEEECRALETGINNVIRAGLPVTEEFVSRELAESRYSMERLPETAVGDVLRIVHVGDYDSCPCSGEHVGNSSDIAGFKLVSTSFENGILRVRFRLSEEAME